MLWCNMYIGQKQTRDQHHHQHHQDPSACTRARRPPAGTPRIYRSGTVVCHTTAVTVVYLSVLSIQVAIPRAAPSFSGRRLLMAHIAERGNGRY